MCEYARGKRVTIGKVDILTVAQARDEAKRILSQAVMGISPSKKQQRPDQYTFEKFLTNEDEAWC